jgi:hypothetical protein
VGAVHPRFRGAVVNEGTITYEPGQHAKVEYRHPSVDVATLCNLA